LRCSGVGWAYALDAEQGAIMPAGSVLGDAVEALAMAARAWVLRLGHSGACPWELARVDDRRAAARRAPDPAVAPYAVVHLSAGSTIQLRAAVAGQAPLQLGVSTQPWELIIAFTGGLPSGRPRDPPGY
jgi:hypothetical protein